MKNILKIENLNYSFGDNQILKNINISVKKEETVAIVGTSGVGKSTLFNLIAGILKKQDGEILIEDSKDYVGKVSYMLQKDLLFEHKTIIENIMLPLIIDNKKGKLRSLYSLFPFSARLGAVAPNPKNKNPKRIKKVNSKKYIFEESLKILKEFGLEDYANKYPKQLSGGMRQRIALIRTYMMKKNIFLLDEAFSALDAITKIELHNWYMEIAKKFKFTTILITHDIDEAVSLSDRIYILKNKPGEILDEIIIEINNEEDEDVQRLKYKNQVLKIMNIK
ncbi:MAG: ABC transporter ATP-binding protein [Fusobacterium sp.]|nr:ABC transporter ATP-binding protein [Fusobacterium sp.]